MKRILLLILFVGVVAVSCDERLEELNTPRTSPTEVPGETLFTNGMREMFDQLQSINVNVGVWKLYAQYWAQTTYPDESRYNMVTRSIPANIYANMYRDALRDLTDGRAFIEALDAAVIEEPVRQNQMATIDVISSYVWTMMVDNFGHIPYAEALDPENLNPAYGDMTAIYDDVISKLDAAISALDDTQPGFPGKQDLVYSGDVGQWIKAANSLKLRLALRLADVNASKAQSMITAALSSGIITENADNFSIKYLSGSPNTNPQYDDLVLSGRSDFVAANTIVDIMNNLNDPRRPVYFRENLGAGVFDGGIYGTANSYKGYSQVGDLFHTPDLPGGLICAAEMHFLLAEAIERGFTGVAGTAEAHYNMGITMAMEEYGITGQPVTDYLAQADVAYTTAPGSWKQKIGTQLWLSLFNNGFEGWTTWRRLDFTGFNVPEDLTYDDIPIRMIYPINEGQRNKTSKDEAAGRLDKGDVVQSRVFWDVN